MDTMPRIKNLILVLFVSLFLSLPLSAQTGILFHNCPTEGDATQTTRSDPTLNILKNRTMLPSEGFKVMNFDDLSQLSVPEGVSKKHRDLWPTQTKQEVESQEEKAVVVVGFLLQKKLEGPESPNCHSNDRPDRDFHIWLANSADDDKSDAIVVEIIPRIRAEHQSWTETNLNGLIKNRAQVRISGWILLDPEHPDQVGKTRATIWEIHPVMKIEVSTGGMWREF
jgi:hypothetical protein